MSPKRCLWQAARLTLLSGAIAAPMSAEADEPTLSIGDVSIEEGNSGKKTAKLSVTLSEASATTVRVEYTTSPGSASADLDYLSKAGTLTFAAGVTHKDVSVSVTGDLENEPNETFLVTLDAPVGASLADPEGTGTIVDNDGGGGALPTLSIGDSSITEGDGSTGTANFTVTLSESSAFTVSVRYATSDGSATAGTDYVAKSGTLTYTPGQTSKTVAIKVKGDLELEGDEAFFVTLDTPTTATLADALANGAIVDDDSATLTVTKAGTGGGTVVATGIECPNDCSQFYPLETLILLTPQGSGNGRFTGWSGDCSGTGSCAVVMSSARAITATFVDLACRNGLREEGEECDDGNDSDSDSCRNNCTLAYCGDGAVRSGVEQCDPGSIGGSTAACDPNCTAALCGDGFVNSKNNEQCDDGNDANGDSCTTSCQASFCGDGFTRAGVEACDPGSPGGFSASCDPNCTAPVCGDGIVNPSAGEDCDSGMPGMDTPSCDSDCTVPDCRVAP